VSHKFIYHFRDLGVAMFENWCPSGLLLQRLHTFRNSHPKALPLCMHTQTQSGYGSHIELPKCNTLLFCETWASVIVFQYGGSYIKCGMKVMCTQECA
jgi:hypothetical protein